MRATRDEEVKGMMRHGHAAFFLLLGTFVGVLAGCRSAETPPPLQKTNMEFTRDISSGKGCLNYSWGSEAKRQLIQLNPSIKEGDGEGPTAAGASHVRVHALTNGQYSLKEWQFPSGPPHSSPVIGAMVEVKGIEAVGTVFYEDQSSATDTTALVPMPVTCPATLREVRTVDPELSHLDPRIVVRNTPVTITVIGSHFTRDSVVLIDGANPTTRYVSPSVLEAELDGDDTAVPGKRGVKVHGAKGGTMSNEVMLLVE
jgi:hypothetical protein